MYTQIIREIFTLNTYFACFHKWNLDIKRVDEPFDRRRSPLPVDIFNALSVLGRYLIKSNLFYA